MAEKIELELQLKSELGKATQDFKDISKAGGFKGPSGAKAANKIQGLLNSLEKYDLSNLKPAQITQFLNELGKLRHHLDSAARSLSTYSKEYQAQQKKVDDLETKVSKVRDKETEALAKQEQALKKYKEELAKSPYEFYDKTSGNKIANKNFNQIATAFDEDNLKIMSKGKDITNLKGITDKLGLPQLSTANKEVETAKFEVNAADAELKAEKLVLEGMPTGGDIHPVTAAVGQHTAEARQTVVDAKDRLNIQKQQDVAFSADAINDVTKGLDKQSSSLGKAFKQFSIYAIAVRTARQALNSAAKTIKDLDKYLTEQAMVTGKTRKETYALLKSYQQMAGELGATTKEVAQVATQFMRQGKTAEDAMTLTRAAISAAKVAGISATESVNYLTTALNGFRLSAEEAMRVSDKFASIAAQSATSYEEIAIALSKVAAQANMAGMSIDYTTALLAKGIETTREAPETIGTALKTIIARMRELTDYGATLEDGMSINNVETQLRYVGIALRNQNGELRSTEEVLDELGGKWEELSSNQQAAIAKALAGTRQQSRLIAMMSDYERVTELQQIAERSAGATAAQAASYMQGMEAALNKVSVAWEKIVTALTNSDVIINLINLVGGAMDSLGSFLESTAGVITAFSALAMIGITIVGNKMTEIQLSRQQQQITINQQKAELQKQKVAALNYKENQKATTEELKQLVISQKQVVTEKKQTLEKTKQAVLDGKATQIDVEKAENSLLQAENDLASYEAELSKAEAADYILNTYDKQQSLLDNQLSTISTMKNGIIGMIVPITTILGLFRSINIGLKAGLAYHKATQTEMDKEAAKQARNNTLAGSGMFAKVVSAFSSAGIPGVIAGVTLATALLAALGIGIAASMGAFKPASDKASDQVNTLSNEIYKLTEKANAIAQVEKQFDALDNKIIKTAEDTKEMAKLLESAADKLTEEDKATYENLKSNQAKRTFLEEKEAEYREEANEKRQEQLKVLRQLNDEQRKELLTAKDANSLMVQDAVFSINNNTLYEYIDTLEEVNDGVESMTQNILEMLSAEDAWTYANEESGESIKKLVNTLNNASDIEGNALVEILNSDESSIKDRIEAYDQLKDVVASMGDPVLFDAFTKAYQQWDDISSKLTDSAINFMDKIGLSVDGVNELGAAIQKLGYKADESKEKLNELFSALESGTDLRTAITNVLGVEGGDYQKILNAYEKATGVTLLNVGQNIKSLQSQINSFYEKASKWGEMDETEKTQFIQDNYTLFQGKQGAELYKAFEEGNYKAIQHALATNDALREQIALQLQNLKTRLEIAEAQEKINDAEVSYLKEQIAIYEDYMDEESSIYQADLKLRLEKEQAQLDLYKEYLEKQRDALTDSLDKRKEAYEKYFDAIDREEADEEYDAKADLLTANLSKLSSSTNASALQQTKELQQKFEDLEKERLQELRERAREAVLDDLDSKVSQINEKFDKLLENEAALLSAMQGEISTDPNGFANKMISSGIENMTATQKEDFVKNSFNSAFSSELPSDALDNVNKVTQQSENLYLNIKGQDIQIGESAQQDLYLTVMNALRQLGLK